MFLDIQLHAFKGNRQRATGQLQKGQRNVDEKAQFLHCIKGHRPLCSLYCSLLQTYIILLLHPRLRTSEFLREAYCCGSSTIHTVSSIVSSLAHTHLRHCAVPSQYVEAALGLHPGIKELAYVASFQATRANNITRPPAGDMNLDRLLPYTTL